MRRPTKAAAVAVSAAIPSLAAKTAQGFGRATRNAHSLFCRAVGARAPPNERTRHVWPFSASARRKPASRASLQNRFSNDGTKAKLP